MSFTMLRVSARNALNPKNFGLERAAILVVALVLALNVFVATGRSKPADGNDADPPAAAATHTAAGAPGEPTERPNRQAVKKRVKVSAAPDKPPVHSAQLFQVQKVILDATGIPALDPHRAQPLPIKIDIVARVDAVDVATAGATGSLAVAAAGMSAPETQIAQAGRGGRSATGKTKVRAGKSVAAAAEEIAHTGRRDARGARKPEQAKVIVRKSDEAPAASIKVAAARSLSRPDPTPGELVMRSLRGDV